MSFIMHRKGPAFACTPHIQPTQERKSLWWGSRLFFKAKILLMNLDYKQRPCSVQVPPALYLSPVCAQSHSGWWPVSWCWCTDAGRRRPGWDPSSPRRADGATCRPAAGGAASSLDRSSGPHIPPWPENPPGTGRPRPTCNPHSASNLVVYVRDQAEY